MEDERLSRSCNQCKWGQRYDDFFFRNQGKKDVLFQKYILLKVFDGGGK